MKCFLMILFCWPMVTEILGHDVVLDFISMVSATWSNRDDITAESTQDKVFETQYIPVDIPALKPHPVVFNENSVNGIAYGANLGIVREDEKKHHIIHVDKFVFRNTTKYRPGAIKLDQLYNLTLDEIDKNCTASFVSLGYGIYSGLSPTCMNRTQEGDSMFSILFTCDFFVFTVLKINDRTLPSPFLFRRIGRRYPLIHYPDDFVNPCLKRKQ